MGQCNSTAPEFSSLLLLEHYSPLWSLASNTIFNCIIFSTIKMDLREIGVGDVDSIRWAQDRDRWRALVNTVMNLRVP
jgi:hypothetical protein